MKILHKQESLIFDKEKSKISEKEESFQNPNPALVHSLILRTVLGAANLILGFKAVIILDVHLVMILGTITPFVSMYLSSIMLGEKVRLIKVLISLFCAFGILLIVDPSVIFKADEGKNHDSRYFLGIILIIVSTCVRALSGIILKKG